MELLRLVAGLQFPDVRRRTGGGLERCLVTQGTHRCFETAREGNVKAAILAEVRTRVPTSSLAISVPQRYGAPSPSNPFSAYHVDTAALLDPLYSMSRPITNLILLREPVI